MSSWQRLSRMIFAPSSSQAHSATYLTWRSTALPHYRSTAVPRYRISSYGLTSPAQPGVESRSLPFPRMERRVDQIGAEVFAQELDEAARAGRRGYIPRSLVQASMPYTNPHATTW